MPAMNSKKLAAQRVFSHQATVVCSHCGEGAISGLKGGYIVRIGDAYRHAQPLACAYVIERKHRITVARKPWHARLLIKLREAFT
jgi:hypothetical protein